MAKALGISAGYVNLLENNQRSLSVRLLMSLADAAGAYCAFLNLPDGSTGTATIESKTNFFRAVRDGHVDATSRPLHVGRTTIVVETDLHDASGKHVARVTQTQAVLA